MNIPDQEKVEFLSKLPDDVKIDIFNRLVVQRLVAEKLSCNFVDGRGLAVIQTLPKFMECTEENENSVKSLISSAKKNDDIFEEISGISPITFEKMVEARIINKVLLTIALEEYHLVSTK